MHTNSIYNYYFKQPYISEKEPTLEYYTSGIIKDIKNINVKNKTNIKDKFDVYIKFYEEYKTGRYSGRNFDRKFNNKYTIGFATRPNTSLEYYIIRGWSESEAVEIRKNRQTTNSIEAISQNHNVDINTAKSILNDRSKQGIDTFKNREDYIEIKEKRTQTLVDWTSKNKKTLEKKRLEGVKKFREDVKSGLKKYNNPLTIEYYTNKGLTQQEAKDALSERQRTFSRNKCIERYGLDKGLEIWKNRQEKWQKTLKSKPADEIIRINKSKLNDNFYSKESIEAFDLLINMVGLKESDYLYKENELVLYDRKEKKCFMYDFCIPNLKIIVEYNGYCWHVHEDVLTKEEINCWKNPISGETADSVIKKDYIKSELAKKCGYNIYTIWNDIDISPQLEEISNIIKEAMTIKRKQ
jgi:hypothetical protein